MTANNEQRLHYILQLRGVAALSVVICHYCHFFWLNQGFCSQLTQHHPVIAVPKIATILDIAPVDLGNFGVALFFLITGFLMPLVSKQKTRKQFITRRLKRIYPPYLISLLVVLVLGYCYAQHQLKPYPWSYDHLFFSLLLIRDIGQYPFIDGIVWTLEIELKFYILCAIALPWLSNKPTRFIGLIIGLSTLCLITSKLKPWVDWGYGLHLLTLSSKMLRFISFIGMGCILSYWHQRRLLAAESITASIMLVVLYYCHGIGNNISTQEIISYSLATIVFLASYVKRQKFTDHGMLAQTGKISYSLYLVHGVPGFFILYSLADYSAHLAIALALIYAIVAATIFYWLIEQPFLKKNTI